MKTEEIYRSKYDRKFKLELYTYENIKSAFKLLIKLLTDDKKFENEEDIDLHRINITAVSNFIVNNIMTLIGGVKIPKDKDEKTKNKQKFTNNHQISFYNESSFRTSVENFYNEHLDNMKDFTHYIYNVEDNQYYAYIGITTNKENALKIQNYYKSIGYDTFLKDKITDNDDFINVLRQYDELLSKTDDTESIKVICNQVLSKYEELVKWV